MSQSINPLQWVVDNITLEDIEVDIPFLNLLAKKLEEFDITLGTYGDLLKVLEYLEYHKVVVLTHNPDGSILIRKEKY